MRMEPDVIQICAHKIHPYRLTSEARGLFLSRVQCRPSFRANITGPQELVLFARLTKHPVFNHFPVRYDGGVLYVEWIGISVVPLARDK
jgi:hypothetical protein